MKYFTQNTYCQTGSNVIYVTSSYDTVVYKAGRQDIKYSTCQDATLQVIASVSLKKVEGYGRGYIHGE
jgi:hypothetical protein